MSFAVAASTAQSPAFLPAPAATVVAVPAAVAAQSVQVVASARENLPTSQFAQGAPAAANLPASQAAQSPSTVPAPAATDLPTEQGE